MKSTLAVAFAIALLAACGEDKAPKPKTDAVPDAHPVKNVESLPSGNVQEGARTMNRAADMGSSLEQQKQARDKGIEAQDK
jgi:hypothetical protein